MEDKKWARKLDRELVHEILSRPEFTQVKFEVDRKKGIVSCEIILESTAYFGTSICSTLDKFDEVKGRNKALGRAFGAYKNQASSMSVRTKWEEFPASWAKRQIERVLGADILFKSRIIA